MAYGARVILDSVSPHGSVRLTTIEATYPRLVHAELLTHRAFSRNASSNRALPFSKVVQQVIDDPVLPVWWGKKARTMEAPSEVDDATILAAQLRWLAARDAAVEQARLLDELGLHKQIVNRVLEPYQWITTIITATDWRNFFKLRCHKAAQPEIREIAVMIRDAYNRSRPQVRQWHLPYLTPQEIEAHDVRTLIPYSVARCARVSFLNHDGQYDPDGDLALYRRLTEEEPAHASPLEHVAEAYIDDERRYNLRGWISWRYAIEALNFSLERLEPFPGTEVA